MNQKPEYYQTKQDWLGSRSLGASSLCSLMSEKDAFVSKNDLYNEFALGKRKVHKTNDKMLNGIKAESHLRNLFAIDYPQYEVIEPPSVGYWVYRNKLQSGNEFTTTPDGILKGEEGYGGLEIKHVDVCSKCEIEEWEDGVPIKYFWQCIGYFLAMPELSFVILYAHIKHFTYDGTEYTMTHAVDKVFYYSRTDCAEYIDNAEKAVSSFYEDNIKPKKRPVAVIHI